MFAIKLIAAAVKDLERLDRNPSLRHRLRDAIDHLAQQPRPEGAVLLAGRRHRTYRLRVGDYRVLYEIDNAEEVVTILAVLHRRDAYRTRS